MAKLVDTLLLLALPASGKSEVRRYLSSLSPEQCQTEFGIGHTVQLDDFPYVHFMRRVDEELTRLKHDGLFFKGCERPFKDPYDWGTLIHLLNEDYADLRAGRRPDPGGAARYMLDRLDRARQAADRPPRIRALDGATLQALEQALEAESADLLRDKRAEVPDSLDGKTIVIEFARGGADGSTMPLAAPFGYRYSLSRLAPQILERSSVLYVWVTPEESRRKNVARTDPDDPGSILNHGTPLEVMLHDYGCDDIDDLIQSSDRPGHIAIEAHGRTFQLPIGRFDNRVDRTTFVRDDQQSWPPEQVRALHQALQAGFEDLVAAL